MAQILLEKVVSSFYNDDIMTFTPTGEPVVLPQKSTIIDFAYEVSPELAPPCQICQGQRFSRIGEVAVAERRRC